MAFKILVRSSPGSFTSALKLAFEDQPYILLDPENLDWSDAKAVTVYIAEKTPSLIINYGLVPLMGNAAEIRSLENVVNICSERKLPLIHFSSYRVFGNDVPKGDILESTVPTPSQNDSAAQHLLAMENLCLKHSLAIVLRQGWMLSGEVDCLLDVLVPKLINEQYDKLVVSEHAFGSPVQLKFAVNVVFSMLQQILCGANNWGVFHLHSVDTCSEAEFCDNLVRLLKAELDKDIDLPTVASIDDSRVLMKGNGQLGGRRCTDNFGIQLPTWRKGLKALVKNYLRAHNHIS